MACEAHSLINHDIRSALSDVLGGMQLIDAGALDPASRQQFERVCASAELLATLTTQALDAAADETLHAPEAASEAFALAERDIYLGELLDNLRRRWEGHAAARGGAFGVSAEGDLRLHVLENPVVIERILANLIENSLRHAAFGRVTLTVQQREDHALSFAVADEGPGFSDAALSRLFAFGGRPGTDPQAGTGLGLHIAKHLAVDLGGDLEVCNVCDAQGGVCGACVSFVLPSAMVKPGGHVREATHLRDMRILVADDNETCRSLCARMLEDLGADCVCVSNGTVAYERVRRGSFDLAIIDMQMPGLTGIDTIRKLRALPGARGRIPILVMTGMVMDDDRLRLFDAGADTILAKPVLSKDALADTIAQTLCNTGQAPLATATVESLCPPLRRGAVSRSAPAGRDASKDPACNGPEETVMGETELRAGRLSHLMDIAGPGAQTEFIERLCSDLARSRATLATAFYERDLPGIRAQTHVLISLTGAIGANALHNAVRAMNRASQTSDWAALHRGMSEVWPDLERVCEEVRAARGGLCASVDAEVRPA